MMDVTSAFKSEILRPLVTLVIPGAIANAPYILVVAYYFPEVTTFWNEHESAFVAILVISVLSVGLILENLGSVIEWNVFDEILDRKDRSHKTDWEDYLKLWLDDEIIGQRYLRQSLTRLKFELSMAPALFFFLCGLLWTNRLYHLWQISRFIWLAGVILILMSLMLIEHFAVREIWPGPEHLFSLLIGIDFRQITPAIQTLCLINSEIVRHQRRNI